MPTTYNFTGQRLDSETGLLYYGARYYDPLSGRFTQADLVLNNAEGMDPYAYVGENPESRTDPTGERFISPSGQEAPPGPITTSSPYSNLPTTPVEQQGYAYENVLSPGTAYNGLPLLLNAFLYDHNTWVQAESYAEYQLHSSLLYLLGMQAWLLIRSERLTTAYPCYSTPSSTITTLGCKPSPMPSISCTAVCCICWGCKPGS